MIRARDVLTTWFGSGLFPFASGTAGTLASLPLVVLLWWAGSPWLHAGAAVVVFAIGVAAAGDAAARWGRPDPGQVVIDETAGLLVATLGLPPSPGVLLAAFLLFRAFDIVKPWPARALERLHGSWGIMADDIVAGLYANLVLQAALWGLRRWA